MSVVHGAHACTYEKECTYEKVSLGFIPRHLSKFSSRWKLENPEKTHNFQWSVNLVLLQNVKSPKRELHENKVIIYNKTTHIFPYVVHHQHYGLMVVLRQTYDFFSEIKTSGSNYQYVY